MDSAGRAFRSRKRRKRLLSRLMGSGRTTSSARSALRYGRALRRRRRRRRPGTCRAWTNRRAPGTSPRGTRTQPGASTRRPWAPPTPRRAHASRREASPEGFHRGLRYNAHAARASHAASLGREPPLLSGRTRAQDRVFFFFLQASCGAAPRPALVFSIAGIALP